jgi:cysteinyl-tRNA synthetase
LDTVKYDALVDPISARIRKARDERDYETSDRIRDAVIEAGYEVKITKDSVEITPTDHADRAKLEALI